MCVIYSPNKLCMKKSLNPSVVILVLWSFKNTDRNLHTETGIVLLNHTFYFTWVILSSVASLTWVKCLNTLPTMINFTEWKTNMFETERNTYS